MTCRDFIEFLLEYDEGRLPPETRAQFDEHLTICPDCVNYLASYRAATALGKRVFNDADGELPESVPEELILTILALRNPIDG